MANFSFFFDKEKLVSSLKSARMDIYYWDFVIQSLKASALATIGLNLVFLFILNSIAKSTGYTIIILLLVTLPVSFVMVFNFMLKTPEIKIVRSRKNIDAEITSAIRFFTLDLKANAPVYEALENVVANFEEVGKYLNDVITKVKLGYSLPDALSESVELVPSEHFRVFLWQIINHLQTGTDITDNLNTLAKEIVETQRIEFKKYGKKLNVLSLFYMIIAIILPTVGFTIVSAIFIFIGVKINTGLILGFWFLFTIMQIIFLIISTGAKPVVES